MNLRIRVTIDASKNIYNFLLLIGYQADGKRHADATASPRPSLTGTGESDVYPVTFGPSGRESGAGVRRAERACRLLFRLLYVRCLEP